MSKNFIQIHIHFVFAAKYRRAMISAAWENNLYQYITGICKAEKHKVLSINGTEDHLHMLVGMHPAQSVSDFMRDVKANSSRWINENQFTEEKFEWQRGYGAFSYSKSQLNKVIHYISNQKTHHLQESFSEEYENFLKKFETEDPKEYLFEELN